MCSRSNTRRRDDATGRAGPTALKTGLVQSGDALRTGRSLSHSERTGPHLIPNRTAAARRLGRLTFTNRHGIYNSPQYNFQPCRDRYFLPFSSTHRTAYRTFHCRHRRRKSPLLQAENTEPTSWRLQTLPRICFRPNSWVRLCWSANRNRFTIQRNLVAAGIF